MPNVFAHENDKKLMCGFKMTYLFQNPISASFYFFYLPKINIFRDKVEYYSFYSKISSSKNFDEHL